MFTRIVALTAAVLALSVTLASAEIIKVGGGAGPVKNVLQPVKDAFEKKSGHTLQILEAGGTKSFKDLMAGTLDMASAGFSFDELLTALKKEGVEVADKAAYKPVVVATAKINLFVNKSNPIAKLSKDQIKGIFTGKITNWKEVGGSDSPVVIVIAGLNPATNVTFQNQMLDGAPYTLERGEATTTDNLVSFIEGSPEAIGFGPANMGEGALKQVEGPDISRVITFVTKGAPLPKVQKLLDFVLGEGKSLIKN